VSVCERLEYLLHPWTGFVVIPIFALANAGIELSGSAVDAALTSPVTYSVVLGLVLGKPIGVALFVWAGVRVGLRLPPGLDRRQVLGLGLAAGIGFTVAIFVAGLAFEGDAALLDEAKIGILAASVIAAAVALLVLLTVARAPTDRDTDEAVSDDAPRRIPPILSPSR
jgi:NhaA family Na+:H+ antiporter